MKPDKHRHGNAQWFKMFPNSKCPKCDVGYKEKKK